jgi:hypothetical protein
VVVTVFFLVVTGFRHGSPSFQLLVFAGTWHLNSLHI